MRLLRQEYLAMGEVPTNVRSTFMQKSRWCKGGMQIFFSRHNAMLAPNLTFMQKVIWNTSGWAYICTTVTTPVFQARRPRHQDRVRVRASGLHLHHRHDACLPGAHARGRARGIRIGVRVRVRAAELALGA